MTGCEFQKAVAIFQEGRQAQVAWFEIRSPLESVDESFGTIGYFMFDILRCI